MAQNISNTKTADSKYKLKVYYGGPDPMEEPIKTVEFCADELDRSHCPRVIKFYTGDHSCHQYVDTLGAFHKISQELGQVLDAVIVNGKQRAAVDKIVGRILLDYLGSDISGEGDSLEDPLEY